MFYKLFSSSPQFTKRPETSGSGFDIIDVIIKFQSPKSIPSQCTNPQQCSRGSQTTKAGNLHIYLGGGGGMTVN